MSPVSEPDAEHCMSQAKSMATRAYHQSDVFRMRHCQQKSTEWMDRASLALKSDPFLNVGYCLRQSQHFAALAEIQPDSFRTKLFRRMSAEWHERGIELQERERAAARLPPLPY